MSHRASRTARLVSLLLNPSVLTGGFFLVLIHRYEPAGPHQWLIGGIAILFTLLIPIGVLFVFKARGLLSDVEMRDRSERAPVYFACAASYLIGLVLFIAIKVSWPLMALMALLVPSALALAVFNHWWKVSIHTTTLAGLAALGLAFFGPAALLFALVVPLAAWARWAAGAHTVRELTLGVVLGASSAVAAIVVSLAMTGP